MVTIVWAVLVVLAITGFFVLCDAIRDACQREDWWDDYEEDEHGGNGEN